MKQLGRILREFLRPYKRQLGLVLPLSLFGEAGLGDGVHGTTDQWHPQLQRAGELGGGGDLGRDDVRCTGYQQDVVEGQTDGGEGVSGRRLLHAPRLRAGAAVS